MKESDQKVLQYPDLWSYLADTDRPIILYGMGDGADKVISVLSKYGKTPCGVFASDEFVRGQEFHGMKVMKYDEVREKYDDPIILVSFASARPDVCDRVYRIETEYETYIPDVPVYGENIFNSLFKSRNEDKIDRIHSLLSDERSKSLFDDMIRYKLYGLPYLLNTDNTSFREMLDCFDRSKWNTAIDLGAYTGDTTETISSCTHLCQMYALEPDPHTFKRLESTCLRLSEKSDTVFTPMNAAAWEQNTVLSFKKGGSRSSRINGTGKTVDIQAISVDSIGIDFDFIKLDVEGAEKEAIIGCKEMISRHNPDLCISVYHRSEDIFEIPQMLHEINGNYDYFLRRPGGFPAWDICLLARKKDM